VGGIAGDYSAAVLPVHRGARSVSHAIGRITKLVRLFLQFARSKAGADLVGRIAGSVPELDKIGV
jgi:hypothetical protein